MVSYNTRRRAWDGWSEEVQIVIEYEYFQLLFRIERKRVIF